jgi:hypothetical protein
MAVGLSVLEVAQIVLNPLWPKPTGPWCWLAGKTTKFPKTEWLETVASVQ